MTNLKLNEMLESFQPLNANPDWKKSEPIAWLNARDRHHPLIRALTEQGYSDRKQLYVIPCNSWYREDKRPNGRGLRSYVTKSLTKDAMAFAEYYGWQVWDGVVKINDTQHSYCSARNLPRQPSFFVGYVPAGAEVLLYDDQMETGATLHDMMRYVESSGAHVVGIVERDRHVSSTYRIKPLLFNEFYCRANNGLPAIPEPNTIAHPDELLKFVEETRAHPKKFSHIPLPANKPPVPANRRTPHRCHDWADRVEKAALAGRAIWL